MANDGLPLPTPPPGYVWVDERRVEQLEASVARLLRADTEREVDKFSNRGRFFSAFSAIERIETKLDAQGGQLRALLGHFKVPVPEAT